MMISFFRGMRNHFMIMEIIKSRIFNIGRVVAIAGFLFCQLNAAAQQKGGDSLLTSATLPNIVAYALSHQPTVQQSLIDEKITDLQVKSRLSDWFPQINFNYGYQHNFQIPGNIIGGNLVRFGVNNQSALQFSLSQTIFNRDVLLAKRTGENVKLQARQQTTANKIDVAVDVSKAFYDVLATQQQIKVADENIVRLEKSLHDAKAQYDAGIVDKTDFKRATIALNNSRANKKGNEESLKAKKEYLRVLMNYPKGAPLEIIYDSLSLAREAELDTNMVNDFTRRVEYRQLMTQKSLLEANLRYNKWSYIPSLSANAAYNLNYFNNEFNKLYSFSVPNSFAGVTLSFPIFQGFRRRYNVREAEWQLARTDYVMESLVNNFNAEYEQAMANYKSSYVYFNTTRENIELATEVYEVINLQYRSGVKTYLEVITAETDLRTAQIIHFNALYQVLSSKLDVMKSRGEINFE
jgi:outer membrane protein